MGKCAHASLGEIADRWRPFCRDCGRVLPSYDELRAVAEAAREHRDAERSEHEIVTDWDDVGPAPDAVYAARNRVFAAEVALDAALAALRGGGREG